MIAEVIEWPGNFPGFFHERRALEFHPIANVFPLMEGEEFRELCEDIGRNGQQTPILTYEGKILDGRNRYRACLEVGEEPWTEPFYGSNPVEVVMSLNLHRRHLTVGQKAMIAQEAEKLSAKRARERQRQHGGTAPGRSKSLVANLPQVSEEPEEGRARDEAARILGISPRSIQDAKKLSQVDPDAAEKVRRGEVSLNKAMEPHRKPKSETTVRDTLAGESADSLDLPPFNLPEERRVYRKIITNLKDIVKLDPERIASFCKGPEEADREDEHLSDLIERLDVMRSKFREKKRELRNLRAVK